MKKITLLTSIFLIVFSYGFGQSSTDSEVKKTGRPNLPGYLMFEIGSSMLKDAPSAMSPHWFRSKGINVYYLYDLKFGQFSFNPGIGMGIERYGFKKDVTITDSVGGGVGIIDLSEEYERNFQKSKFTITYLDIPLEFRYHFNKENPERGFKIAIGGYGGALLGAATKIKDSDKRVDKVKDRFKLSPFRYGVHARIGIGDFNVGYYYGLSEMFKTDKGPSNTDAKEHKVVLSFNIL